MSEGTGSNLGLSAWEAAQVVFTEGRSRESLLHPQVLEVWPAAADSTTTTTSSSETKEMGMQLASLERVHAWRASDQTSARTGRKAA